VEKPKKLRLGGKHTTTKPDCKPLERMSNNIDADRFDVDILKFLFRVIKSFFHLSLNVTFQAFHEVLEHRGTTRKCNVVVKGTTSIDRTSLDSLIDNLWKRVRPITTEDFRAEKDFGSKESLISNIDLESLFVSGVDTFVLSEACRVRIILLVLFDNIRTNIAIFLFDFLSNFQS